MESIIIGLVEEIADLAREKRISLSLAESCTAGMIASYIASVPGASDYFEGGFVTYSDRMKEIMGVKASVIQNNGAVSEATANAMALACLEKTQTNISLAVTGIAGPGGGSKMKPVGTVSFAVAWQAKRADIDESDKSVASLLVRPSILTECHTFKFEGDRDQVRRMSCERALQLLMRKMKIM